MTVNMKSRFFCAVLFIVLSLVGSVSAQKKNILRVRFETAKVKENTKDIVLSIFYKLEAPKPCNFHGYQLRFNYEKQWITPTTTFFEGTASQYASFAHGTNDV